MNNSFSHWTRWSGRSGIPALDFPGVYIIAHSSADLNGAAFSFIPEIIYVGMTNARKGLRSRLRKLDGTLRGGKGHGGAVRVRYKLGVFATLAPDLFVSVCAFPCDVESNQPSDLRQMGEVALFEYECIARFVETCGGKLPEFNDKARSPKK
jgi:hypothetical protein